MPEKPLLVFPTPVRSDRRKLGGGPGPSFRIPSPRRQSERLRRKFAALRRQFDREAARLQVDLAGTEPEQVIVLESVGSIQEFYRTLERERIPGLEWLAEWDKEIQPDEDFYFEERPDVGLPGRVYLVMSNQSGIQQLLSLWNQFTTNPEEKFPYGLGRLKHVFEQLKDVRRWGIKDRVYDTGVLRFWQEECRYDRDPIRFDVELWYRKDPSRREQQFATFRQRLTQAQGQCVGNQVLFEEIRYHGTIIELPRANVMAFMSAINEGNSSSFLEAPEVFLLHPIGQTAFPLPPTDVVTACPELRRSHAVDRTPVVALLDGLPLENHPSLAGRLVVDDPEEYGAFYPASERHHGTAMASLIVHGDLAGGEEPLASVSLQVIGAENHNILVYKELQK